MDQQVLDKKKPRLRALSESVTQLFRKHVPQFFRKYVIDFVRKHFDFLAKLPTWGFILAVAMWTVLFKTALVPIVALLNAGIFAPLGLDSLYSYEPVLEIADALTRLVYDFALFSWDTLSTLSHVLIAGILFPLLATLLAQVIPQYALRKKVPSERRRGIIAVVAMGLVYLLAYGEVALLISGSVIAIPLVFTFFHRMRAASLTNAYLISTGIHAIANTIIVVFRGLLGGD